VLVRRRPWLGELAWVIGTALVAMLVTIVDLALWRMSPSVPLYGESFDSTFFLTSVKGVVEHGWFTHNPDLAAPIGQSNFDFAAAFGDTAHYGVIRALALVFDDPVVVANAFFLLGFPLTAVAAYGVLRDLGSARAVALVTGVLFAFLPYHVFRNQAHLFLSAYYAVPLGVWLVVALAEGRTLIDGLRSRRTATTVAVCALVAAASNYYAVFTMLTLVLVTAVAALAWRSRSMAVQSLLVLAAVGAVFALCHAPSVIYTWKHGENVNIAQRKAYESEYYGLKLTHMLIPRPGHRIGRLANNGRKYELQDQQGAESFSPSLGVVATAGLLGALLVLLTTGLGNRTVSPRRRRVVLAGTVALVCFLIGTQGGISSLIAFEITPQVRAWNRISIFIAFAALLAVALALTAAGDRLRARRAPRWIAGALLAVVGILGILDQTSPRDKPDHVAGAKRWHDVGALVSTIEDRLPRGSAVLQLPYMPFPENGPILHMRDYEHFNAYLHSGDLRWSYGAARGRPEDWQDDAAVLTTAQLVAAAPTAGFGGIYIDRRAYGDFGASVMGEITTVTGAGPVAGTADGRLVFFDLGTVAARLAATMAPSERAAVRDALVAPVAVRYGSGFSYLEAEAQKQFRWAPRDAQLELDNPLEKPRRARLTARLVGGGAQPSSVMLTKPDGSRQSIAVTDQGTDVAIDVVVPPGGGTLRLHTEGPAAPNPPGLARDLRLRVIDARLRAAPLAPDRLVRLLKAARG
jgi:phosphoglycerol transferase